jgi:hypothetical protein
MRRESQAALRQIEGFFTLSLRLAGAGVKGGARQAASAAATSRAKNLFATVN